MKRALLVLLFLAVPLSAQNWEEMPVDDLLLRNVSGTAANPGNRLPHLASGDGEGWTFFMSGSAHATYVSETGPAEARSEVFSTNWITAGAQRTLGERGLLLFRGRASLEPFTIADDEGYPQILQWASRESGGPILDRMRPHDLIGEAAVQLAFRTTESSYFHVYAAPVGDPALGPVPFAQRSSAMDFAEAPFSYDLQENFHDATSVVTAGYASGWITVEASIFHDAVTFGDHTDVETGDIDSRSARVTLTPSRNLSIQFSRGELGNEDSDLAEREISSASLSWGTDAVAFTALWTRRDQESVQSMTAFGGELTLRGARHTFMVRAESVDRPQNFPFVHESALPDIAIGEPVRTSHFTAGYIYDVLSSSRWRGGLGVNIDYHTQTHDIEDVYGHKPQSIYTFVRFRTR